MVRGTDTNYIPRVGGGGGGHSIVIKAADETVNNSNALQDDDELFLAVGANEKWLFEFYLLQNSVSINSDLKFGFNYPVGCSIYWGQPVNRWVRVNTTSTPGAIARETDGDTGGSGNLTQGLRITALVINGANAGFVTLKWCQNTATVEDTKILAESCIIATKLN
jgi:hypothetical protein